ncbi:hypothetical protein I6E38_08970 [Prevotella stercorea]|uniref:fimbrillin family protein n=1 Tax=Leyella stercorea TaxID=363265 RepID=UPI001F353332|nr:fimbrillin family protein [Leyella stercorea]MCF2579237.1 hypothetical protein [Leyella stercorea]
MKKTILLALAAVATIFTSCSSDIANDNDDSNNGQGKGMTLIANVEQDDTRATFEPNDTCGSTWKFTYTDNDQVQVGNNLIGNYYTFTKSGANFSCADAKATNTAADWYAYYPSTNINLTNQQGTTESAADLYALAGKTEKATTGAEGLTINMKAQAAVLRIVKVDNYGPCDIYLKTADGKYVSGLKAKKNEAGYDVVKSDTKVSVFTKESTGNAGIYYVIVPAGVKISVYNTNDENHIKTTKTAGLTAGRYYTLTTGPTTGTATATINGKTEKIGWVQMWIGGPRFAIVNVAKKMNWAEAAKTGDEYVWGKNWQTPLLSEVEAIVSKDSLNTEILKGTYENNNKHGFTLTGKQPGYTANELFLSGDSTSPKGYVSGKFWVSDDLEEGNRTTMNFHGDDKVFYVYPFKKDNPSTEYEVRPVLTIKTVLWREQNIQ